MVIFWVPNIAKNPTIFKNQLGVRICPLDGVSKCDLYSKKSITFGFSNMGGKSEHLTL
jgi:hypothetical protein